MLTFPSRSVCVWACVLAPSQGLTRLTSSQEGTGRVWMLADWQQWLMRRDLWELE